MKVKRRKGNSSVIKLVLTFLVSFQWFLDVHGEDLPVYEEVPLDFTSDPSRVFNSSTMPDRIRVYANYPNSKHDEETPIEYKVSVVLERMNVSGTSENRPQFIVANSITNMSFVTNVDYTGNFNDIRFIVDDDSFVEIIKVGEWTESDEAALVATIYYEADGCSGCPHDTFCCEGGQTCYGEPKRDLNDENDERMDIFKVFGEINNKANTGTPIGLRHQSRARCLNMGLRCNDHPNCAMHCNADETDDTCYTSSTECGGNTCFWNMSFVWTALLAIVFFIMAPTVVVFLICYHRQLTVVGRRRGGGGSDVVTVSSPANDLPPRYDELVEETPPCFHCATSASSTNETSTTSSIINSSNNNDSTTGDDNDGGGGINNLAFLPEDSMANHKSILCSCPSIRGGQQLQQQPQPHDNNRRTNNKRNGIRPLPKINGDVAPSSVATPIITTTTNNNSESRNSVSTNNIDSMA